MKPLTIEELILLNQYVQGIVKKRDCAASNKLDNKNEASYAYILDNR